ncbi:DrmB family protein [Nocardia sp. NPDC003979]
MSIDADYLYDPSQAVAPLDDADKLKAKGTKHNRAKVGSARPSSLLYTYGPGAVMDLPNFTIMPTGLDDWDRIYDRRDGSRTIHAPRLREAVAKLMKSRDVELRPHPWQAQKLAMSTEGNDLGVPARVFPQWLRCTGCDLLGPLTLFKYHNTHPFRSDQAAFEHTGCTGRKGTRKAKGRDAVAARYLLACADGHLDEFPYNEWVHRGRPCTEAEVPRLKMPTRTAGKGAAASIDCTACGKTRSMSEAQGAAGREKLPKCRGRHPHLDAFEKCGAETRLMLIGASNLWFPVTQSVVVMPVTSPEEHYRDLATLLRIALGSNLAKFHGNVDVLKALIEQSVPAAFALSDDEFAAVVELADKAPEDADDQTREWDPIQLLVPEWKYLLNDAYANGQRDEVSGLTLARRDRGKTLPPQITRVLAVESLRKVNALLGFTRIDELDRVDDVDRRFVPIARAARPKWTVATEDLGEGIFLQLDEDAVTAWEKRTYGSKVWKAHTAAHKLNFERRHSDTAADVHHESRLKPPRYWLVHGLAHILIRELAMTCGYNAASLSERLYAWQASPERPAAAGLLICTTASDSDGTLGGLVEQSRPALLERVVTNALRRAMRCPSDPICSNRTPRPPEDFLHGAACHCCVMASETSCERANRFLDRRFLIDLPGSTLGFFQLPR